MAYSSAHDEMLEEVRRRVGSAPRRFSMLRWFHGKQQVPAWAKAKQDDLWRIYAEQDRILRDGIACWAVFVQANSMLYDVGADDCPAQVIVAPDGDVALAELRSMVGKLFDLKGTPAADPQERRFGAMLADEMGRTYGFPVPRTLAGGRRVVSSTVMVYRRNLPGRRLVDGYAPALVHPKSHVVLLLPQRYWPGELVRKWTAESYERELEERSSAVEQEESDEPEAEPAKTGVTLTRIAAQMILSTAAQENQINFRLRVGVKRQGNSFSYILDITDDEPGRQDQLFESHGVQIMVDAQQLRDLAGTVIDYRKDQRGSGFLFSNPNAS